MSSGILMTARTKVFSRGTFDYDKMTIGIYEYTEGHHKVWVIPPLCVRKKNQSWRCVPAQQELRTLHQRSKHVIPWRRTAAA